MPNNEPTESEVCTAARTIEDWVNLPDDKWEAVAPQVAEKIAAFMGRLSTKVARWNETHPGKPIRWHWDPEKSQPTDDQKDLPESS
jgi:hypothetical protein